MEKNSKKLRVSYTLLSLWSSGRIDDALIFYFKLAKISNKYMEDGKKWDRYVNDFVVTNKKLPPEFGSDELKNPKPQEKWEIDFMDRFSLVGVPDVVDHSTLYEIKTGNSKDSGDYANDFQIGMYLFIGELLDKKIKKAVILHYDQYRKELDKSLIWNTLYERKRAENYILSIAPDIYEYFLQNNLFNRGIDKVL